MINNLRLIQGLPKRITLLSFVVGLAACGGETVDGITNPGEGSGNGSGTTPPASSNQKPVIDTSRSSQLTGMAPLSANFDASASSDSDGTISQFFWDFGDSDNSTASGETASFVYNSPGSYEVTIKVTDDEGAVSEDILTVNVQSPSEPNNMPPVARINASALTGDAPMTVNFDASASSDDSGIQTYNWNFGDGSSATGEKVSHQFTQAGNFEVTLTVNDGSLPGSATTTINVKTPSNVGNPDPKPGVLQYASFNADSNQGQSLYLEKCSGCHGETGVLSKNGGDATSALDVNKYTAQTLFTKIHEEMPVLLADPTTCVDQCAADITAYLETWRSAETASCDNPDGVGYGQRSLVLLTREQYQNTLEDVLGVTKDFTDSILNDATKGKFPNNSSTHVDENRMNKYWGAANEIAQWAVANNQPFSCGAGQSCSSEFIDDVLYRLFRRPVTKDEREQFEEIFNSTPGAAGLETAIIAALTSPQFLYLQLLGNKVSDVLANEPEPFYRPSGNVKVHNFDGAGADGFALVNYYIGGPIDYKFSGEKDSLSVVFKAEPGANGEMPKINRFTVSNQQYPAFEITSESAKTYYFEIDGKTDNARLDIGVDLPNGAKLYIGDVKLGKSELYTPSRGDEDKMRSADQSAYVLNPFEYATFLAYTLTGTAPDKELLDAAATDGLHYEDQIGEQVARLIDSPRGKERMGVFAGYWFDTERVTDTKHDRDPALFPSYTQDVRVSMKEEVRALFREIFYSGKSFNSFYSGDFTVVNSTLSDYYGISSGSNGPNDWKVVDNLDKRGGILTTGAFMTVNAHPDKTAPIIRAVRLREQALCQHIAPPPLLLADRDAQLALAREEDEKGIATSRRYYEVITDSPACDGCHKYQINPLFGMEDFDQVGQWRDTQKGSTGMTLDIDDSGILYGYANVTDTSESIAFNGAKDLSKSIADLPGIESCLMQKSFRFIAGMPLKDSDVDSNAEAPLTDAQKTDFACAAEKAKSAFDQNGQNPRAVLTEFVMQDLMRYRK